MADVSGNPWRFISTDVSSNPYTTDRLRVQTVRWTGCTTATHAVVLKNTAGRVVWQDAATSTDHVSESNLDQTPGQEWDGLIVDTLGSGTVEIYLK